MKKGKNKTVVTVFNREMLVKVSDFKAQAQIIVARAKKLLETVDLIRGVDLVPTASKLDKISSDLKKDKYGSLYLSNTFISRALALTFLPTLEEVEGFESVAKYYNSAMKGMYKECFKITAVTTTTIRKIVGREVRIDRPIVEVQKDMKEGLENTKKFLLDQIEKFTPKYTHIDPNGNKVLIYSFLEPRIRSFNSTEDYSLEAKLYSAKEIVLYYKRALQGGTDTSIEASIALLEQKQELMRELTKKNKIEFLKNIIDKHQWEHKKIRAEEELSEATEWLNLVAIFIDGITEEDLLKVNFANKVKVPKISAKLADISEELRYFSRLTLYKEVERHIQSVAHSVRVEKVKYNESSFVETKIVFGDGHIKNSCIAPENELARIVKVNSQTYGIRYKGVVIKVDDDFDKIVSKFNTMPENEKIHGENSETAAEFLEQAELSDTIDLNQVIDSEEFAFYNALEENGMHFDCTP